jgi:uncharacterized protein DUF1579
MKRVSTVLATILISVSLLAAQTGWESQRAVPAHDKLNYFAGTWNLEVHVKASPFVSKAFFGTEHNEWTPNGSLLVSRQEGDAALAAGGLVVMAYHPQEKTYTYHVVKSTGETEDLRGTLDGNAWTWTNDQPTSGKGTAKSRLTITELSPVSYSLKLESALDGTDWSTIMEGKATKVVPHARQDVAFLR